VFDNLIESKPKKQRTVGQTIVSVAFHGALIFLAITATKMSAEAARDAPIDTTRVFLKPPPPAPPPPDQPPPEVVVAQNPPPKGFQTIVAPDQIPTEIPPIDLNEKPFDPKDFTGKGVEGGSGIGVVGGTGPVEVQGEVFLEAQLDDPVQAISQPTPRYPPVMQAAGIAGKVTIQFIVGTDGKVEPGSIKILSSTNKAFEEPARETIAKSVFRPAKYRGQPVRQLVQQVINFQRQG
jgi:protein TonB